MEKTKACVTKDADFGEGDGETFEAVVNAYLCVLDHQQHEIYNVRMMHHEVWRDVHQVTGISETRAGSRVERYTKILPIGAQSDVDYKLCVKGLEIESQTKGEINFESSRPSKAYCRVYVTSQGVQILRESDLLSKLFKDSIRECQGFRKCVVIPAKFKTNVVEHCKFEMKETKEPSSPTSPAVSGEGAHNPYDIVPCLKLKEWPTFLRKKVLDMYSFRSSNGQLLPIFIVPTGNPLSQDRDFEWRMSFAVLEIEIFRQLKNHQRRLYGLAKYLFKVIFEELDVIQAYHLKILFLLKLEDDDLSQAKPLSFLANFFRYVLTAVEQRFIPHLFIEDCNIYPVHYYTDTKKDQFRLKLEDDVFKNTVRKKIKEIISHDMRTDVAEWECWLDRSKQELEKRQKAGLSEVWVAGYLTRLLSVITYCLRKSQDQGKLHSAVNNLVKLVQANHKDKYVKRIIPHIKCMLNDVHSLDMLSDFGTETLRPGDRVSLILHRAFYCYEKENTDGVMHYLAQTGNADICEETLGVTVTKFHKGLDQPLDHVIDYCEEQLNSNRFYLHPKVMHLHLNIQMRILEINDRLEQRTSEDSNSQNTIAQRNFANSKVRVTSTTEYSKETEKKLRQLNVLVNELVEATERASLRDPYTGKLSYRHGSRLLLLGYKEQFAKSPYQAMREVPLVFNYNPTLYERKELVTNFDLR